ncbi:MAG: ribonuclease H-like domain-containing protein [Raineya sp.]
MYNQEQICRMLFLDIETARSNKKYEELSEGMQKMWEHKAKNIEPKDDSLSPAEKYYDKAAIYAEFGRVVCISCGFIYEKEKELFFRVKSFYGKNEKKILEEFKHFLDTKTGKIDGYGNLLDKAGNKVFDNNGKKVSNERLLHYITAHNGREFDIPYLCRRYLINQISLPQMLEIRGKKPWEILHLIDTMEMWKFGDNKNFTKLELLCNIFEIPTPKDDIDGSQVGNVFWEEENYERIAIYCEKDVVATAQLMLKYNLMPLIKEENIQYADRIAIS